ncbi:nitrogenase cofactor biosynthesis protein NifB [Roseospira navarrensis]|uniref:FeMo cofactor biosynthesis protein NifB n=2 Tax=Roseospira navarrensis TaxID=140058 RepID=A0A7X1ZI06_9PROT|nr:nitrogenase cofactor biosynthesis protein NifB [Roseospira navarrensis]
MQAPAAVAASAKVTPLPPAAERPRRVPHNKRREADAPGVWERIKDHPCYSEEAHHYFARMHVAVAPGCNIQCNYCNRKYDCSNESRPGVVSNRLTPEGAVEKVRDVAARMPQLSVVGVAGPGDGLFQADRTLRTFELLRREMPDLTLCLSTNGLALPDHIDALKALDIGHVTITINYLDPEIGAEIHPWVFHNHRRWRGVEAARILHERQMEGLERATAAGVLVKVNSVLIPGINDDHMAEVNRAVRARGAFLHNVMPLISDPAHGTVFGLDGRRGPTPAELHVVRESLSNDARLMKHCRQCRADAVGMLGEDQCQTVHAGGGCGSAKDDPDAASEAREAWRAVVADSRAAQQTDAERADALVRAVAPAGDDRLVAVCTRGGGRVNLHFGKATEFHVYAVGADGIRFAGIRRADNYCLGGYGESERLDTILSVLEDVSAMVCVKVGAGPRRRLEAAGIACHEDTRLETIETTLADWYAAAVPGSGAARAEAGPA